MSGALKIAPALGRVIWATCTALLIVYLIYVQSSIKQSRDFVTGDCDFQALRTPNAETLHLLNARVDRDRAKKMDAASAIRKKSGATALAKIWSDLAADERQDADHEESFAKATYSLYLVGCGAAPTPAPDLHYFTAPPAHLK